jgi:hypothetical protein
MPLFGVRRSEGGRMENKVVVHMRDRRIHKGVTHDFDPSGGTFHLLPAEGGGVPIRIRVEEMKALFYVKDYLGNREFVPPRRFGENGVGTRVILTFADGETLWGTVGEGSDKGPGFFFYPSDERDNNIKIFVVRSSLTEMRLVP